MTAPVYISEADIYALADEYVNSYFAYSNALYEEVEAARNAFIAGFQAREELDVVPGQ